MAAAETGEVGNAHVIARGELVGERHHVAARYTDAVNQDDRPLPLGVDTLPVEKTVAVERHPPIRESIAIDAQTPWFSPGAAFPYFLGVEPGRRDKERRT